LVEKSPLVAKPVTLIPPEDLSKIANCGPGFVGPIGLPEDIPLLADRQVLAMQNFSCGANREDTHYLGVNWQRDIKLDLESSNISDFRLVQAGDRSPDDKGTLSIARGIEVGHIFMLGTKYSSALKAEVLDENGKTKPLFMGCYGIGVSRIVAAAIEQNNDANGIIWPSAIAPYQLAIIPVDFHKNAAVKAAAVGLYDTLRAKGVEVLLDDRNERPGMMFKDMDLIGIPHRVVISPKSLEQQQVEYKSRISDTVSNLGIANLVAELEGLME
jgi:prolyl-tRNA synthetase